MYFCTIGAGISELYPVHLLRSQSYFIESQKQINCISKISKSQWIIHTGYYFDEEFSSSLLTTSEVTTLHLSPNALPYGMYRICVHVEMVIDPVFYKKACGYVNVIATRLLAVIDGGEEVQRSYKFDVSDFLIFSYFFVYKSNQKSKNLHQMKYIQVKVMV